MSSPHRLAARSATVAACALAVVCGAVIADTRKGLTVKSVLSTYDKDGDGKVSQKEFRVPYDLFAAIDQNKDGFATRKELGKKGMLSLLDAALNMGMTKLVNVDERTSLVDIIAFDENFDGRISSKEFRRFAFALADQDSDEIINFYEAKYLGRWSTFAKDFRGDAVLVMQRFDKNKDGVIEEREFKPGKKEFKVRDQNGDGSLTADELEKRPSNGLQAFANFEADALIEKYDKNGDGVLTLGEIPGGKGSALGKTDRDQDGKVSRDELDRKLKYAQSMQFSTIDPSFIERFDLNGDHRVSRDEFPGPDNIFERLDKNGDKSVSKADG